MNKILNIKKFLICYKNVTINIYNKYKINIIIRHSILILCRVFYFVNINDLIV